VFLGRTKLPLSCAAIAGSLYLTCHVLHSFILWILKGHWGHDHSTNRLKGYKASFAEILAELHHTLQ